MYLQGAWDANVSLRKGIFENISVQNT
jgi:hypothetical protein